MRRIAHLWQAWEDEGEAGPIERLVLVLTLLGLLVLASMGGRP